MSVKPGIRDFLWMGSGAAVLLVVSLNQKRRVTLVCRAALTSLQQAVVEEPIPGMTPKGPVNPRKW